MSETRPGPPPRRWGLACWRLGLAGSAFTGVWLAAQQYDVWWTALSQLASLAAGVGYLVLAGGAVLAVDGPRCRVASAWFRGATASTMALVAIAFLAMQHGNLWDPYSVFEHLVTPAAVVADRVLIGTRRDVTRWWHPWSWLLPPTAYLAWYVAGDLRVYVALDPSDPTAFVANTTALLALVLVAAFTLHVAAQRRLPEGAVRVDRTGQAGQFWG